MPDPAPLAGPSTDRPAALWRWIRRPLPPSHRRGGGRGAGLPGVGQRRRLQSAWLVAALTLLLRPWPPFQWLSGWWVGLLLLWAIGELVAWLWWPQRSA